MQLAVLRKEAMDSRIYFSCSDLGQSDQLSHWFISMLFRHQEGHAHEPLLLNFNPQLWRTKDTADTETIPVPWLTVGWRGLSPTICKHKTTPFSKLAPTPMVLNTQATDQELERSRKKATSAKSAAKPKNVSKKPRSPEEPNQSSPNPGQLKRVKGKRPEADDAKKIEELRKVLKLKSGV